MAMCPFAYTDHMLKDPDLFRPNANGTVKRIVVRHTAGKQSERNQAGNNAAWWVKQWRDPPPGYKKIKASAHFTVEANGMIFQHVNTADIAMGTATFTGNAVHIEHSGSTEPFTRAQLHASALLMAWIVSQHPDVPLTPVGTGLKDFGDAKQVGVTCHAFVDLAAIAAKLPYAPKSAKVTCPGVPMMNDIGRLALLAGTYRGAVSSVTSTVGAAAATFFDWSGGSPVSR